VIDAKTFNLVSQAAHVYAGVMVVLAGFVLSLHRVGSPLLWLWVALSWIVLMAIKEAFVDPKVETPAVQGSGLEDFLFSCVGVVAGVGMVLLCR
jgi:hypothetical protein